MVSGISYNNIKVAVRKIRLKFEKKRDFRGGKQDAVGAYTSASWLWIN